MTNVVLLSLVGVGVFAAASVGFFLTWIRAKTRKKEREIAIEAVRIRANARAIAKDKEQSHSTTIRQREAATERFSAHPALVTQPKREDELPKDFSLLVQPLENQTVELETLSKASAGGAIDGAIAEADVSGPPGSPRVDLEPATFPSIATDDVTPIERQERKEAQPQHLDLPDVKPPAEPKSIEGPTQSGFEAIGRYAPEISSPHWTPTGSAVPGDVSVPVDLGLAD